MRKIVLLLWLSLTFSLAESKPVDLDIRVSAGTDATLGLAYGIGAYHKVVGPNAAYEIGVSFYGANSTETSNEYGNDYTEETTLSIVTVMYNYLYNYDPKGSYPYLITGVGLGLISYDYTQYSTTDSSLGSPYGTSGSIMYDDATVFGNMLNLGIGKVLANGLDFRVELPIFILYDSYYDSTAVAFALTVSLSKAFSF